MAAFEAVHYTHRNPWGSYIDTWGSYVATNATTETTLTFDERQWGSNVTFSPSPPETPPESPREAKLRRNRASSRRAVLAALAALRGLRDDPDPRIPPLARKGLSGRPAARKRVCAGSSRYRVLVN